VAFNHDVIISIYTDFTRIAASNTDCWRHKLHHHRIFTTYL